MKHTLFSSSLTAQRRSIAHKLILYVILFSFTITMLATGLQVYLEYSRNIRIIQSTLRDIETSHLSNIINSLWVSDLEFLKTQLTGISRLPDVQFLEIRTDNESIMTVGTFRQHNTIKKQFDLVFPFKGNPINLGTLAVHVGLNGVYQRILNRVVIILVTQSVIAFLVSAFIVGLFYLLIGRHLIAMSDYAKSLHFDGLEKPLVLNRNTKENYLDELRQLELAINEMRENLTDDIRKREKIERQLRESETKHRTLLDNIPQKIFYKDTQSIYITCNKNYASDLSTTEENIAGKTDFDFFPLELAEKYRYDDQAVLAEGVTKELEESYVAGRNEYIVQTVKTPIFDAGGSKIGLLGIFWDITQKKQAELELQKTKAELETRVRERTARLQETNSRLQEEIAIHKQTEEKLIFAKQDAEKANQAKSEFLSNISHELRTPMHHILNYSRFGLEKGSQVPLVKLIHYFSQIRKTGNRLMILLNDLLDLSKLESGRAEYKIKRHNIMQIVEDAISEIGFFAREKNVELITNAKNSPILVNCDAYKIGQVFRNLLSNAIKYSPDNEVVEIELAHRDVVTANDVSSYLRVSVADRGIGIPEMEFNSIFDKFTQSSKTKTGAGGSGLGLAICKEIVEGHQGRIWVKNNHNRGATFYFTLPLDVGKTIQEGHFPLPE